ncbi:hypothetical protein HBI40_166480 [Parastagonospora nodorum]|nr:hypothetical protein HBI65_164650 [Parastagonospora nodorum]KAH6262211.1 hypothetical protein HBI41_131290 [Parastagonospora nodorum]KAH6281276.1 hypothetical protein HBI40_166480 [Parastagonospora nodorum]
MNQAFERQLPIHIHTMEPRYKPLPMHERTTDQALTSRPKLFRSFWIIPLTVVTLFNIAILFVSLYVLRAAGRLDSSASTHNNINSLATSLPIATTNANVADNVAKVEPLPVDYVAFHWDTPWGSRNVTEADQLWEKMNTAHGHIAIDHAWAAVNQWPPSMDVPGKPGKGLYLLQAYHQLHCLRVIRSVFLSMYRQTLPDYPIHHAHHCFDAIRQHIMCNADNTPLYGHGDGTSGDGQMHQCKSWTALRNYATRNSACFRDGKPGMTLEDRFGVCDNGTDGLEEEVFARED